MLKIQFELVFTELLVPNATIFLRGDSQMMGRGVDRFLTKGRGGCVISTLRILTRGEGVQNPENLADVICEWPLNILSVFDKSLRFRGLLFSQILDI